MVAGPSEPVLSHLCKQRGSCDPEEDGGLSLVAASETQGRGKVALLGSIERFRHRLRRPLSNHEIWAWGDAFRRIVHVVRHHDVSRSLQRGTKGGDVVAIGVIDHEPNVEGAHAAKLLPRTPSGQSLTLPSDLNPIPRMPPPLDLSSLATGDELHHPLLVIDVVTRTGDHPRTTLILGNRTGRIETSPFWAGRDEAIRGISKGMQVQAVGQVTRYRDSLQLEVTSVRALPPGSVPLSDLVPSVGSVDKYWQFIDELRQKLTAPRLRAVVDLFYADEAFRERYEQCPGAPGTGHHASLGGLLQHTCEVISIGRQIARIAHADEEIVVAGALLHDIGKLEAYSWNSGVFETTERGRMIGHVVDGVLMLRDAIRAAGTPPCTVEELMLLEHLILSHHGLLEYGAPVRPLTLEAEILHTADNASAKTASISDAYASAEYFPGDARVAARRVWQLDNRWLVRLEASFGRETSGRKNEAADQAS